MINPRKIGYIRLPPPFMLVRIKSKLTAEQQAKLQKIRAEAK